jgi:predicted ATPase
VELRLDLLPAEDIAAYVAGRLGGAVTAALAAFVHERTEGNALFMVHIVEHLLQQGLIIGHEGQWTLLDGVEAKLESIPEEVRQMLLRRIEELPPATRQVLEAASVAGQEFAVAAVAAGAQRPVEEVEAVCEGLAAQQHFLDEIGPTVWPDGTSGGSYRFLHTLYPQVLYGHLGSARRRQLHQRLGVRLEAGYGAQAGEIASRLAFHFERGGELYRAVRYLQQVADNATRRNTHHEAVAALTKGIELLATVPESPLRTQRELTLLLILGQRLIAVKGFGVPEVGDVYTRAHTLVHQAGNLRQRCQVLQGLYRFYVLQAQLRQADELSQLCFRLTSPKHDIVLVLESYMDLGLIAFYRGDPVAARAHLEHSLRLYDTTQLSTLLFPHEQDSEWRYGFYGTRALWLLGYADQAQQWNQEALTEAQQVGRTPSLARAQHFAAILSQHRRDMAATQAYAEAVLALATAQGFAHRVAQGRILLGWALAMQGAASTGVAYLQQGLEAVQRIGQKLNYPYHLALLAEGYGQAGQPEAGLSVLDEALARVATTEERWWEAEVFRLKGALLLQLPSPDVHRAETCFQQALAVARSQQAKALELRAALSLSRLWQQQGKGAEAHEFLTSIYGWFTEGFDTADLQEAQVLLEKLAQ